MELKSVTIMGKASTGLLCNFDTEEIWGINNVADHPEYRGAIIGIKLLNKGEGYKSPPIVSFEGDGRGVVAESALDGDKVKSITVKELGWGFSLPPKVILNNGGGSGAEATVDIGKIRKFHKLFAFDLLDKQYTDGMKRYAPIVSWQDYADIRFPLDEIIKEFNTKYFTNTVSYMLAYAIYLKIPLIKIYGVDVTFGAPYAQENRGVEYWIGRAQERGCEVFVPPESQLLRTVSGGMYGEKDHCNVSLYLGERIGLLNLLPREGRYSDILKSSNAQWVLHPKSDEAQAHNVQIIRGPNGESQFSCPAEFLSDVHMPPETWEYVRGLLIDLERAGKLPVPAIPLYEKLILSKPPGGN